jgi:hypothetical protein
VPTCGDHCAIGVNLPSMLMPLPPTPLCSAEALRVAANITKLSKLPSRRAGAEN